MPPSPVRVMLVDDHRVVRDGLRRLIESEPGYTVVGEAASAEDLLRSTVVCDVVLLDLSMPGIGGFEALKLLHSMRPEVGIVVLTMRSEDEYAVRCLRAGALAFLSKGASTEEILGAISNAAQGKRFVTGLVADVLVHQLAQANEQEPHVKLSDRELEVLHLLAGGIGVSEIARRMFLSVKTVSTYKARIHQKLGVRSTAGLVRYAMEHGLTASDGNQAASLPDA